MPVSDSVPATKDLTKFENAVKSATGIHGRIGADLEGFGGFLRCESCGHRKILGSVSMKLRDGWPTCCGHTMRWWTQRQIDAGEVPALAPSVPESTP